MTLALLLIVTLFLGLTIWLRQGRSTQIERSQISPFFSAQLRYLIQEGRKPDALTLPPDAGSGMEPRRA